MQSWNMLSYLPYPQNNCGGRGILKRQNQKFKTQEKPVWGEHWKTPDEL